MTKIEALFQNFFNSGCPGGKNNVSEWRKFDKYKDYFN